MGILEKISNCDLSEKLITAGNFTVSELPPENPPSEKLVPCPECGGRHFWLDCYGNWNCVPCFAPHTPAMVRGERRLLDVSPVDVVPMAPHAQAWTDPDRWTIRTDHAGRQGLELVGIPERERWWARCDFDDLLIPA
jgi:hypothetical protein